MVFNASVRKGRFRVTVRGRVQLNEICVFSGYGRFDVAPRAKLRGIITVGPVLFGSSYYANTARNRPAGVYLSLYFWTRVVTL